MKIADTLQALGRRLAKARQAEAEAMDEIRAALPEAIAAGVTEVDAAKATGLDRMTIRKMLGKDPRRGQSAG
jgi:dsDNA-specific endonuclease/ATPase MutS2